MEGGRLHAIQGGVLIHHPIDTATLTQALLEAGCLTSWATARSHLYATKAQGLVLRGWTKVQHLMQSHELNPDDYSIIGEYALDSGGAAVAFPRSGLVQVRLYRDRRVSETDIDKLIAGLHPSG